VSETGYLEDCCFNYLRDYCSRNLPKGGCKCRCHVDHPDPVPGTDRQTLLFVADDLRRTAEAHIKSAGIAGKRIERKHLHEIAKVLIERAVYYEATARTGEVAP
jgi:hypothetical protein